MRNLEVIKSKRVKLYEDLALLKSRFTEIYYSARPDENKEVRSERYKEMRVIEGNKKLIEGQIEALTFVLNEDYKMSELTKDLKLVSFVHGDWRDDLGGV